MLKPMAESAIKSEEVLAVKKKTPKITPKSRMVLLQGREDDTTPTSSSTSVHVCNIKSESESHMGAVLVSETKRAERGGRWGGCGGARKRGCPSV